YACAVQEISRRAGIRQGKAGNIRKRNSLDRFLSKQNQEHSRRMPGHRLEARGESSQFDGRIVCAARRRAENGERRARECFWEKRRDRGRYARYSFVAALQTNEK